mmetsp:Transcript_11671/g.31869  ORF Transcript_11671/g.31869 Transcript_11671/m.31869 type:complete len:254 (+) Transcript_11671:422-1183(+)
MGSLSTWTSQSLLPSVLKRPMKLGSLGPTFPATTSTGTPRSECTMKRADFSAMSLPDFSYFSVVFSSPESVSQSRQGPPRSQDTRTVPSGLKSRSRTSFFCSVHALWRVGASRAFAKRHILTRPSVPPVATRSPDKDALATLISGCLPFSSHVHSHTSFSEAPSSAISIILQRACKPANQQPVAGMCDRWTTTLFSVFRVAVVTTFPVTSSRLCTCTWLGTSLEAVEPPPPPVRKVWWPSLARPRIGTAFGGL